MEGLPLPYNISSLEYTQLFPCACLVVYDCVTPWTRREPARLLYPWNFPGKNSGAGFHFSSSGIFQTQGSNPHLLYLLNWQEILHHCATWEAQNIYTANYNSKINRNDEIKQQKYMFLCVAFDRGTTEFSHHSYLVRHS